MRGVVTIMTEQGIVPDFGLIRQVRVKSWHLLSGYEFQFGTPNLKRFSTFYLDLIDEPGKPSPDYRPIHGAEVSFGDVQAGPIQSVGQVKGEGDGFKAEVLLPRDELHTFWRALDSLDFLLIVTNDRDEVISFYPQTSKGLGVGQDPMAHLNSLRRPPGANTESA
jgi:hypothetical protein